MMPFLEWSLPHDLRWRWLQPVRWYMWYLNVHAVKWSVWTCPFTFLHFFIDFSNCLRWGLLELDKSEVWWCWCVTGFRGAGRSGMFYGTHWLFCTWVTLLTFEQHYDMLQQFLLFPYIWHGLPSFPFWWRSLVNHGNHSSRLALTDFFTLVWWRSTDPKPWKILQRQHTSNLECRSLFLLHT